MKHVISLETWKKQEIQEIINLARKVKKRPSRYANKCRGRTLLLMFEAPSLRTKLSSAAAIIQLGGAQIDYALSGSPWKKGKETVEDSIRVISRYADAVLARLYDHSLIERMANTSGIPILNGMTNYGHPLQVLGDLMTIQEKKGKKNLHLAYLGDGNNNVTHSLMFGCALMGIKCTVASPNRKELRPAESMVNKAKNLGGSITVTSNVDRIKNMDIIYTDSWMSYRVEEKERAGREALLKPYQVNEQVMHENQSAIFMHCLPALRGKEVTGRVIDGPQSVVLDQAENRLHSLKAVLLKVLCA